jgi:hypothetical protein
MNVNITTEPLRLDGNAAAGMLSEVFVSEPTVALSTCAGCGATARLGALLVYAHGMGTVMRCPGCDGIILRVARAGGQLWLDATGAKCIVLPTGPVA